MGYLTLVAEERVDPVQKLESDAGQSNRPLKEPEYRGMHHGVCNKNSPGHTRSLKITGVDTLRIHYDAKMGFNPRLKQYFKGSGMTRTILIADPMVHPSV